MSPKPTLASRLRAAGALVATTLLATAAQAGPRPLDDAELSAVRGADGSILAGIAPSGPGTPNGLANGLESGLAAAFASSTGPSSLTPAEFAASLGSLGLTPALVPGYAGQPVAQTRVDAGPVTFSFDLSDVLRSTTGLSYSGPSMGTITMTNFDARGTTFWVWHH